MDTRNTIYTLIFKALLSFCLLISHGFHGQIDSSFILVKFDSNTSEEMIKNYKSHSSISSILRLFPQSTPPRTAQNNLNQQLINLSNIYQVQLNKRSAFNKTLHFFRSLPEVIYAEPRYIHHALFIPNDPESTSDWYLQKIQAYISWDISTSDSTTVIAVIDNGVDLNHEDLQENWFMNTTDPENSVDDDNDGYVDNYLGWDFVDNDNNPDAESIASRHGSLVSGLVSAKTNNGIGISSIGYNAKILPIRAGFGNQITHGYEAIVYAANHGAKIINLSWGNTTKSHFEQDIINYAHINMGAVIVAAAGNSGSETPYYPAHYKHVLSVAATNENDEKITASNYGDWIDLSAPGNNLNSTDYGNNYLTYSGTSIACPIVSGAIAHVKTKFPNLTYQQAVQLILETTDNITPQNPGLEGKLGTGRLNVYTPLLDSMPSPSIVLDELFTHDNHGNIFQIGDTIFISGNFINYLAPTNNLYYELSATSSSVEIINPTISASALGTLENFNSSSDPWKVVIQNASSTNQQVSFTIHITDSSYHTNESFDLTINKNYIDITFNNIGTSTSFNGSIGFTPFPNIRKGLGFIFPYQTIGKNLLYESSLIVGNQNSISDNLKTSSGNYDNDFGILEPIHIPENNSSFYALGTFDDSFNSDVFPISVLQTIQAFNEEGHNNYILTTYHIINQSNEALENTYVALFTDWDLEDYAKNTIFTDSIKQLGICTYPEDSSVYSAVKLVNGSSFHHYALDLYNNGNGGINIVDDFTEEEKYMAISQSRLNAGSALPGNDVAHVISSGPYTIQPGDTIDVVFALLAGNTLASINTISDSIDQKYEALISSTKDASSSEDWPIIVAPNPSTNTYTLIFNNNFYKSIEIYDLFGRLIKKLHTYSESIEIDASALPDGCYIHKIEFNTQTLTKKVFITR